MQTGVQVPTPLEWPFSQETNEEQATHMRLSMPCLSGLCLLAHLTLLQVLSGVSEIFSSLHCEHQPFQ